MSLPLENFRNMFSEELEKSILGELEQDSNLNPRMKKPCNEDTSPQERCSYSCKNVMD